MASSQLNFQQLSQGGDKQISMGSAGYHQSLTIALCNFDTQKHAALNRTHKSESCVTLEQVLGLSIPQL